MTPGAILEINAGSDLGEKSMVAQTNDKGKDASGQQVAKPKSEGVKKDDQKPSAAASHETPTRKESFVYGIPEAGLTRKEREVALDELDTNGT